MHVQIKDKTKVSFFLLVILHGFCGHYWSESRLQQTYFQVIVGNAAIFFILFANFYFFAYVNKKKTEEKKLK